MKKVLFLFFILFSVHLIAQDLPTIPRPNEWVGDSETKHYYSGSGSIGPGDPADPFWTQKRNELMAGNGTIGDNSGGAITSSKQAEILNSSQVSWGWARFNLSLFAYDKPIAIRVMALNSRTESVNRKVWIVYQEGINIDPSTIPNWTVVGRATAVSNNLS